MLSFKELCERLSISAATGRSWIRTGRIIPDAVREGQPFFDENQLKSLLPSIAPKDHIPPTGSRSKKKKRVSRLYAGYLPKGENHDPIEKIIATLPDEPLSSDVLRLILAEFALQLLFGARKIPGQAEGSLLLSYSRGKYLLGPYQPLLDDLIGNQADWKEKLNPHLDTLSCRIPHRRGADQLGLLYLCLKDIGAPGTKGTSFTPHSVTDQMAGEIYKAANFSAKTVLDPACGTGNFLLNLACRGHNPQNLYGQDVDEVAVQIARINLACAAPVEDLSLLYRNITCGDSLVSLPRKKYDIFLSHPPWDASFTRKELSDLRLRYQYAGHLGYKSAVFFLEAALSHLPPGGTLSFLLPETILNTASYEAIRALIAKTAAILSVTYLSSILPQTRRPAVILTLQNTPPDREGKIRITKDKKTYLISRSRQFDTLSFSFATTEEQQGLLNYLENFSPVVRLKGRADFAAGIVIGRNQNLVKRGPQQNGETLLKGRHIFRYRIAPSPYTLAFTPGLFVRPAPEKLLYRPSGKALIFAYDNRRILALNGVNSLIPQIENMDILYILALLNSGVMQFYFTNKFRSKKILPSHLEQLPLPVPPKSVQDAICGLVRELLDEGDRPRRIQLYTQIEELIATLFHLSSQQRHILEAFASSGGDQYL